jgi:hypothetical protein
MTDLLRRDEESMSRGNVDGARRQRASCQPDDSTKAGG